MFDFLANFLTIFRPNLTNLTKSPSTMELLPNLHTITLFLVSWGLRPHTPGPAAGLGLGLGAGVPRPNLT